MKATVAQLVQFPGVWRGGELEHVVHSIIPTGHARLDAQLPGGGWPQGTLTEVLHDAAGIGEVSFLAGALARAGEGGRLIAWVNPPHLPYAPALAQAGIPLNRCVVVNPVDREGALWAAEQSLKSGACGAVMLWMEAQRKSRGEDYACLRRLQMAAEAGRAMAVLFRSTFAEKLSSPSHLRVVLATQRWRAQRAHSQAAGPAAQRLDSMLWVALELPALALQIVERAGASRQPLVIAEGPAQRPLVACANGAARAAGIREGQAVAAAKALAGDLKSVDRNPEAEREALERIAAWATQFTPMACIDAQGVVLEVESSLKLFQGHAKLTAAIQRGVRELGFHAATGVAPTPLAARVFARSEAQGRAVRSCLALEELRERVAELPLFLLDWPEPVLVRLTDLGVLRFRDILELPAEGIARRFGPEIAASLDRVMGRIADPRKPHAAPSRFRSRLELPADAEGVEPLLFPLKRLLVELEGYCTRPRRRRAAPFALARARHGKGARACRWISLRPSGKPISSSPSRARSSAASRCPPPPSRSTCAPKRSSLSLPVKEPGFPAPTNRSWTRNACSSDWLHGWERSVCSALPSPTTIARRRTGSRITRADSEPIDAQLRV